MNGNPLGPLSLDEQLALINPFDLDDARQAAKALSIQRRKALDEYRRAGEEAAEAERTYKRALAVKLIALRDAGEYPAGLIPDLARGEETISDLRRTRDIKREMVWVCKEKLSSLSSEGARLGTLTEWSGRVSTPPFDAKTGELRSVA